jgi:hypothetical protein
MAPARALLRAAACALALSRAALAASSCAGGATAGGVRDIDLQRFAGDWYTQAIWGTGANAMLWCALARLRSCSKRALSLQSASPLPPHHAHVLPCAV